MKRRGMFDSSPHSSPHDPATCGCRPTGRYTGGYDSGGDVETSVVLEERTCGRFMLLVVS